MPAELHRLLCVGDEISLYYEYPRGLYRFVRHDPVVLASEHDQNDPTHDRIFSDHNWLRWTRKYGATLEIIGVDDILR